MKHSELRIEHAEKRHGRLASAFLHSPFSILNLLVGVFVGLCLINNVALPIFEAPDESSHFIYANYLASQRHLPNLNEPLPAHEVIQPPLYYALAALAIAPFDRSNLDELTRLNTDWFDQDLNADFLGVRGQHLHTSAEQWPWQGAVWAVHAARLVSTLLGAATVVFVFLIAREITREKSIERGDSTLSTFPLLAAALVAFNPKFVHVSSIVSNDIAITLASTVALWQMVRIGRGEESVERGASRFSILDSRFSILGAAMGAAVLCKLQGLALFAPALVLIGLWSPRRAWLPRLAALLIGFALVAGWYFIYNTLQYGNPLAWAQVQAANATLFRQPPLNLGQIVATVPLWFTTFWGSVGVRLEFPDWVNIVFGVLLALAVMGCVIAAVRGWPGVPNRRGLLLLAVAQVAVLALFVLWLRSYIATENARLIFPGIAPVAVFVALGWSALVPKRIFVATASAITTSMAALTLAAPFVTIAPAYATPEPATQAQITTRYSLPTGAVATFAGNIRVLHVQLGTQRAKPGGTVPVIVYWGGLQPMNQSYRVVLEALDVNNELVGRKQFVPFGGRFATQRWQPGQYFRDEFALPIDPTARRGVARVQLSVFAQYPTPGLLGIDGTSDKALQLGRVKIDVPAPNSAAPPGPPIATFGGSLQLDRAIRLQDGSGTVEFNWTVLRPPDKAYTLFVHVLDAAGNMIGQQDAQPFDGQYPTDLWDSGERVRDVRAVPLQPEARALRIGWYDAQTGQRLTAQQADGSPWPDDMVIVTLGSS